MKSPPLPECVSRSATRTELHRRLQRYGTIDRARNRDSEVDCFLIAGLMFEYCVREAAQSATISIPPFLFASQPVVSAAVRARALDRDGKVEDAAVQWKIVEELCEGLGKKEIQFDSTTRLQIRNAEERFNSIDEPLLGKIKLDYAWYATQIFQARLEQNKLLRTLREHAFRAREFLRQTKTNEALDEYERALQLLATIVAEDPDSADDALRNFISLPNAYDELAREMERPVPAELQEIVHRGNTLERNLVYPGISWASPRFHNTLKGNDQQFLAKSPKTQGFSTQGNSLVPVDPR